MADSDLRKRENNKINHRENDNVHSSFIPNFCNETTNSDALNSESEFETMTDYATALQKWMIQYHTWCMFQSMTITKPPQYSRTETTTQTRSETETTNVQNNVNFQRQIRPVLAEIRRQLTGEQEYVLPPLWKRIAAEFIDFLLLFVLKLTVTVYIVEQLNLVDLEKIDIEQLLSDKFDYDKAMSFTWEVLALELINRIFISIFETLCLRKGIIEPGGATPGKRFMGLIVVSCNSVREINANVVVIRPGGDLGLLNALCRSVIKNFSMAFFFPVCMTMFCFRYGRCAYDIIGNSIVVEKRRITNNHLR